MMTRRLFFCCLTSVLLVLFSASGQEEKAVTEEINATVGKFIDTPHVSNGSEVWAEIHRLRTLINQETDLRLSFEQNFLVHLNTLRGLESKVNRCGETRALVNTNIKWLRNLEHRLNMINSSYNAFLKTYDMGCHSGKLRVQTHPESDPVPVSQNITFIPPFAKKPAITYGVTFLDSDYDTSVRTIVDTTNVTRYGFTITLSTLAVTSQWGVEASWMACPSRS